MSDTTRWTLETSSQPEDFYGDWYWVRPPGHAETFADADLQILIRRGLSSDAESIAQRIVDFLNGGII